MTGARAAPRDAAVRKAAADFERAGRHHEAAAEYRRVGDGQAALNNLVRVGAADPAYRQAAREAVALAVELDVVELRFEHFLSSFIATGPQTQAELDVFYELAQLYVRRSFPENAEEALARLVARDPGHRDAQAQLDALSLQRKRNERTTEGVARAHLRFWGSDARARPLPELPELEPTEPDAPSLTLVTPVPAVPPVGRGGTSVLLAPPADPFSIGATVANRYRIEQEIGRGGMAVVFRAHDIELREDVALKVLKGLDGEAELERFRQEMRLCRRLNHPNIVRLYDIGAHGGLRYISMELLVGETLLRQAGRPMEIRLGVLYLLDACAGLQAAHDAGIIHRDVKPANLFVTSEGILKVMDFGIAKERASANLTVSGLVVGTPTYMAPEQIRGASEVTPALDLYSLGVVGYELFTGTPPFRHRETMPVLVMHLKDRPQPPRARNPDIPEALEAILLRLLEKEPERRFPSCQALTDALEALGL